MATNPHGEPANTPAHRLRFDPNAGGNSWESRAYSGRRFVTVAVLTVLVIWGTLYLVFRDWRTRLRSRAAFGASQVAPVVDSLAAMVPEAEGVSPRDWRQAVDQTHELLVALTAANLLDRSQMERLRDELTARVATARPATVRRVLASIWDDMQARAGPLLNRYPRPKALPPEPSPPPAK